MPDPATPAPSDHEPLRLHIGGQQVKEGWKILNIQPGPGVDFVGDCRDLSRFGDNSVDVVYASHVYEHVSYLNDLPAAFREVNRVLIPGGQFYLSVPDLEKLCRFFIRPDLTRDERFNIMRAIYGGQIDQDDFHKAGLTMEFVLHLMQQANFSKVQRVEQFNLFDDTSLAIFKGESICLNVIAMK